MSPRLRPAALARLSLLWTLIATACGDGGGSNIECGTGTRLDEATDTCVAEVTGGQDFNRSFNANLGDLEISDMNVPDVLVPGTTVTQKFKITNKTTSAKPVTALRLSLLQGPTDYASGYLTALRGPGFACTESCTVAGHTGNKVCEDGAAGSSASTCASGTDCSDCGPRKRLRSCDPEGNNTWTCHDKRMYCEPYSHVCHMKPTSLALSTVEDLKAGETREISWDITVPYFRYDDQHTLVLAANEEWLTKNAAGDIVHDDRQPKYAGSVELERAAAVYNAGRVPVQLPFPKVTVESIKTDSPAFELSPGGGASQTLMNVSAKLMSNSFDNTELDVRFELRMPGGAINDPTREDPDRSFALQVEMPDGSLRGTVSYRPPCRMRECNLRDFPPDSPEWSLFTPGAQVDGFYKLRLREDDAKVLASTLDNPRANSRLNAMGELPGKVVMIVDNHKGTRGDWFTAAQGGALEYPFDVVFMPPPANKKATANDSDEPPKVDPTDDGVYASTLPGGHYSEVDDLTPTFYQQLGSDWLGVSVQLKNTSSKDRLYQAVVKQALSVDDYAAIDVLKQKLYITRIAADVDWGTRRPIRSNKASLKVTVPPTNAFDILTGANTLIDLKFDGEKHCKDDKKNPSLTRCMILGGSDDPAQFGDVSVNLIETKKSVEVSADSEYRYCFGPLCFVAKVGVTFEAGVEGSLGLYQDRTEDPYIAQGIEATLGLFAEATGEASGGVDVFIGTAGIEGEVQFLRADLTPTLRIGLEQNLRAEKPGVPACWLANNGFVNFSGPATLSSLSGEVRLVVDFGPPDIDAGLFTIHLRSRVVEFTLIDWDAVYEDEWMLWDTTTRFAGGPGLCSDVPNPASVWKSPVSCTSLSGSDSYCANSFDRFSADNIPRDLSYLYGRGGRYSGRFYLGASGCGTITLNGSTELLRARESCDALCFPSNVGWGGVSAACSACLSTRLRASPGDVLVFGGANAQSPLRVDILDPDHCAYMLRHDAEYPGQPWVERAGGGVGCGAPSDWFSGYVERDGTVRTKRPERIPLRQPVVSGDFHDTRLRVCSDSGIVNLWFVTDESVALSGVSAKLTTDEGPEATIVSDTSWKVSRSRPIDFNGTTWTSREYEAAEWLFTERAQAMADATSTQPWFTRLVGPFTSADAAKAKWIWVPTSSVTQTPAESIWLRRPFIATKNSYAGQVACDDNCNVYLDGVRVVDNGEWRSPRSFTINTQKGNMHILAIEARNASLGPAGVLLMLK